MPDVTIADRLQIVFERISAACARAGRSPDDVTLIAVTKGFQVEAIRKAVAAGVTNLGENRVQEARAKREQLGDLAVAWHMIGHLQTNKVKDALATFDTIHSLDSIRLAEAISGRALTPAPALLEVNVAGESSKSGFPMVELISAHRVIAQLPNIELRGLMTVAPMVSSPEEVRPVFQRLAEAARELGLADLSMGMTDDFEVAIEEGATHVRVGRAIFGERVR